jgi:UDP-N-acetyl-2-amino-2-deoxyglucuronate dehydrogenase
LNDTVGLAVVGSAGVIGVSHVADIGELDSTRLVGVYDLNTEVAQGQAADLGVKHYPGLEDLLGDGEVDAVALGVPHPLHHTIALEAFKARKHVLTEKPIAATPSQADEMVRAAREAGLTLGVVFQHRFRPDVVRMHSMIDEGALGDLYRTMLSQGSFRTQFYYDTAAWRGTWSDEGGGVLINQGVHHLDLFQWLGGMPRTVRGLASTLMHSIEVEDMASALLEYDNGAHGTVHSNAVQAPSDLRLELYGDRGALVLADQQLIYSRQQVPISEFTRSEKKMFSRPVFQEELVEVEHRGSIHADAIDDFARALLEGREPAVTGEEGTRSLELIAAIILSSCTGQVVDLPIDRQAYDDLLEELTARRSLFRS